MMLVVGGVVLGLVVGSFVNVVASRVPEGRSVVRPRSRCPECLTAIRPLDNIPVVSYMFLRGRCRKCGKRISRRYPLTELTCALAFGLIVWRIGFQLGQPVSTVLGLAGSAVFVTVAVTDLETRRIPRQIVYWGLAVAIPLGVAAAISEDRATDIVMGVVGSLGLGVFLLLIHELNSRWMGFGDVRYAFFLGWVLGLFGWEAVIVALMTALVAGSTIGLMLIALGKSKFGQALPFGPFLSIGAFVGMLWGNEIAMRYLELVGRALGN